MNMRHLMRLCEMQKTRAAMMIDAFNTEFEHAGLRKIVTIDLSEDDRDPNGATVELGIIWTKIEMRNQRMASRTMEILTKVADQFKVMLTLAIATEPDDGGLDTNQLHDWYMRWGFQGGELMKRPYR